MEVFLEEKAMKLLFILLFVCTNVFAQEYILIEPQGSSFSRGVNAGANIGRSIRENMERKRRAELEEKAEQRAAEEHELRMQLLRKKLKEE